MWSSQARALPFAALTLVISSMALSAGCFADEGSDDPLARDRIRALARAQGSASGDARSGPITLVLTTEACDCPTLEVDAQPVDLCALVHSQFDSATPILAEGSGVLGLTLDPILLTGAIDADGRFVIAGIQDLSNLGVSLEALRRMDGQFEPGDARAEGWAGQRLVGELLSGEAIDCRWTGEFVGTR
jgi:hypothetical protein